MSAPRRRARPAARFGRPLSWRLFAVRFVHLNVGLALFGFSIALMLSANVGLGPWDVFHEGLAARTPITIGTAMVLAGLALLLISTLLGVRPGLGSVLNMALIGPWVDLFLAQAWFPRAEGGVWGWALMASGIALNGFSTGLYITAGMGAGPRDGFALALAKRLRASVRRARTGVEVLVFAAGWALGGTAGLGTILFALAIGPAMQTGLWLLRGFDGVYARASDRVRASREPAASVPHDA